MHLFGSSVHMHGPVSSFYENEQGFLIYKSICFTVSSIYFCYIYILPFLCGAEDNTHGSSSAILYSQQPCEAERRKKERERERERETGTRPTCDLCSQVGISTHIFPAIAKLSNPTKERENTIHGERLMLWTALRSTGLERYTNLIIYLFIKCQHIPLVLKSLHGCPYMTWSGSRLIYKALNNIGPGYIKDQMIPYITAQSLSSFGQPWMHKS